MGKRKRRKRLWRLVEEMIYSKLLRLGNKLPMAHKTFQVNQIDHFVDLRLSKLDSILFPYIPLYFRNV